MNDINLQSSKSMATSLESIHNRKAGLNKRRSNLLNRTPVVGSWARFDVNSIKINDLAYLTAKTSHEFALLRGKRSDILFHGDRYSCRFDDELVSLLQSKALKIIAHSHPGEDMPIPSQADRRTLKMLDQTSSIIISATTGRQITYTQDEFDGLL